MARFSISIEVVYWQRCLVVKTWLVPHETAADLARSVHTIPSLEQPLSICPISFNLILQQDSYDLHLTHEPLSPPPPRINAKTFGERSFSYAGPSVWNNLPQTLRHSDSTSSLKTFSCNLPFALLTKWPASFTCYCGNTGVEQIPKQVTARRV